MHDVAHDDSKGQYFWVWGALLVLTAVEVLLAYKQVFQPVRMLEILLILSVIKSALIIGYFMHLKFERALMRWLLVISVTACFIIMYFFFFPDADRILAVGSEMKNLSAKATLSAHRKAHPPVRTAASSAGDDAGVLDCASVRAGVRDVL